MDAEQPGLRLLNDDFLDLLAALLSSGARFLVVGAHAMAIHGVPRATGDLDVWVEPTEENARRVWRSLVEFGAPVGTLGLDPADLASPGLVFQVGQPPRRIDVLTEISGVSFGDAWPNRAVRPLGELEVPFLGLDDLIDNKRSSARPKDLVDVDLLRENAARPDDPKNR